MRQFGVPAFVYRGVARGVDVQSDRAPQRQRTLLPAMGYSDKQVKDLEETINRTPCDVVLVGTPIDLGKLIEIDKPALRVQYELQEIGTPTLEDVLADFLA